MAGGGGGGGGGGDCMGEKTEERPRQYDEEPFLA
jgi:hypothetical protein